MHYPGKMNRRRFLSGMGVALATAPFFTRHLISAPPSETVIHASAGGSGMAGSDLEIITHHEFVKLAAVADVDITKAQRWKERFPGVRLYQDWREMLDKEKDLDSVNVSTPDHMHGPIAMSAMQLGRHVYVQKPLTHEIFETRQVTEYARKNKRVTQMGIQIHSSTEYRLAVRLVQEGVIGKVREVHTWSNKKWGDDTAKPDRTDKVPEGLNWDLWLGVTADRPFIGDGYYHPGNWRKRLDFGTGTFGDMGCHIYDPVFKALALTAPLSVRSVGPTPNAWNWATNALIDYVFPGNELTEGKTVKVTWYDGDQRPPKEIQALVAEAAGEDERAGKIPGQGSIFVGTKGVMLLPHIAKPQLFPRAQFKDFVMPKLEQSNHYTQFLEAVRGKGPAPMANFDYSGPLTEAVLLGGVATRFPQQTLEWNAAGVKFGNSKEASALLRRAYRKGWSVKGLG